MNKRLRSLFVSHYLVSEAGVMVGTVDGALKALNEKLALSVGGSGAVVLYLTEVDSLSTDEAGGLEDLSGPDEDSGDGTGRMGEEDGLSVVMDARGGKHKRVRYSST